jgi:hypothetical protein
MICEQAKCKYPVTCELNNKCMEELILLANNNRNNNMKATINITDTMLNKSIIDANKSVCELAKQFSFDYSEEESGAKHLVSGKYPDGTEAKVTFYKAKTRGDKRISITKLKHQAEAGDVVTLQKNRGKIKILIND